MNRMFHMSHALSLISLTSQERIEDSSASDLTIAKLELEASQLEAEAATSALQVIHDFTQQLAEVTQASTTLSNMGVEVSDGGAILYGKSRVLKWLGKKSHRLLGLTEKLVREAVITVKLTQSPKMAQLLWYPGRTIISSFHWFFPLISNFEILLEM